MSHTIRFDEDLKEFEARNHIISRIKFDKKLSKRKTKTKRRKQKKKYILGQLLKDVPDVL